MLHIDDLRNQEPRVPGDEPSRLDLDLAAEVAHRAADQLAVFHRERRRGVRPLVGNAEPPAKVEPPDIVPVGAKRARKLRHLEIGRLEGREVRQLAADVDVDPHDLDPRQPRGLGIDLARPGNGNPELVVIAPRRDLLVRLRVDVGVHPHGDGRDRPHLRRHRGKPGELRLALHVELADPALERHAHLARGLAHPGKDDPVAGHACGLRAQVLAARHHVHARSERRHEPDHGLVGIGLHGVADEVRPPGQRLLEKPEMPGQRGRRIDIEGRTHLRRDVGDRDILGMEDAVTVKEMVHRRPRLRSGGVLPHRAAAAIQPTGRVRRKR